MRRIPNSGDYPGWVRLLAVDSLRQRAKQHLLASGAPAVPAVRAGLKHPNAIARLACVNILDHLLDEESVPDLVAALYDEDPTVVRRALHSLACDACKEGACRPGEELFVPRALELLHDPNPDLRAQAIDTLGKVASRRPDVFAALAEAAEREPNSGLRGQARQRIERIERFRRRQLTAT